MDREVADPQAERQANYYPEPGLSYLERGAGRRTAELRPAPGVPPPPPAALPTPSGPRGAVPQRPGTMGRLPRALLLLLPHALLVALGAPEAQVSAPQSLAWGPGLQAGVVLPVRYFYVQAVNSEGQNLTRSPPGSVQPRASLVPLPAPVPLPRAPWGPRIPGSRWPPAWCPSPGVLCRPSSVRSPPLPFFFPTQRAGTTRNKMHDCMNECLNELRGPFLR